MIAPRSPTMLGALIRIVGFGSRHPRRWSAGIICLLLVLLGWIDYKLGVVVSLAPLYVVPIALSVLWIGPRAGALVALCSVVLRVGGDLTAGGYPISVERMLWNRIADLGLYLVLVAIMHALVSLQRQLESRVRQRTAELESALAERSALQRQLFDISRRERSSIGHELHDGLGQHLTATSIAARMLSDSLAREKSGAAVAAGNIVRLVQDAIAQTRRIARGLLLSAVEPDALAPELEELAARLGQEMRVETSFSLCGDALRLDVSQASHLYYIAQEALRNALRHAAARSISITLSIAESEAELHVADDGRGLPEESACSRSEGMGLRIMRHRAELMGGVLLFGRSAGGVGTCVTCRIPLTKPCPVVTSRERKAP